MCSAVLRQVHIIPPRHHSIIASAGLALFVPLVPSIYDRLDRNGRPKLPRAMPIFKRSASPTVQIVHPLVRAHTGKDGLAVDEL